VAKLIPASKQGIQPVIRNPATPLSLKGLAKFGLAKRRCKENLPVSWVIFFFKLILQTVQKHIPKS
jgi:hypothetical protein